MWSLVYLLMSTLVALILGTRSGGRDDGAKDLEILVLRHQLRVLRRTAGRPQLRTIDRVLLAATSRVIPRDRWVAFLVFIELGSRRIHLSPSTVHPDWAWVTQQARNLVMGLDGRSPAIRFLIRDRDVVAPRDVRRRGLLGGLIHEYHGAAA